jgi:DNA recombination-dependent growth factor C
VGVISGSVSYSTYHVQGSIETVGVDAAFEAITKYWFRPLLPDAEEETSVGWCDVDDLLAEAPSFPAIFRDGYLCLSIRADKWAIPSTLLKAHVARRERALLTEQSRAKLFRTEKDAIRAEVLRELRHRALASASVVDMVWNLEDNRLRLWSQSSRANERFAELFTKTFDLRAIPDTPYVAALQCGLEESVVGMMADAQPARFLTQQG